MEVTADQPLVEMFPLVLIPLLYAIIFLPLLIEGVLSRTRQLPSFVLQANRQAGHKLCRNMASFNSKAVVGEEETRVFDVLTKSLQRHIDDTGNEFMFYTLEQSSALIQRLGSEALAHTEPHEIEEDENDTAPAGVKDLSSRLRALCKQSLSTSRYLHLLVYQMNNSTRSKKTSGNAWKTLQSIVDRSLDIKNANLETGAIAFAILSLGIAIATYKDVGSAQQKMIASAVIPNSPSHIFERETCKGGKGSIELLIKTVARDSLIHLLRNAIAENDSIDVIARIENAFGVGSEQDKELSSAVANVVKDVFGNGCYYDLPNDDNDELGGTQMVINKDKASPTLALVAQCRPWELVQAHELVKIAAGDLDLWYSAELVCDASVNSITSKKLHTSAEKNLMATSYSKFQPSDLISAQSIDSSLRQDTIAHLTTRALIDTALDLRLYRRADLFASKFYAFGGAERFAEARFLHACDTITKLVKRKMPQVIEKQVPTV